MSSFELLVGFLESVVHFDRDDALVVTRQIVRDVFKRQKGCRVHQELAEQQRRSSGLAQNAHRLLGRSRAGVVWLFHLLDGFKNAVLFLKIPPSLPAVGEALADHHVRLHAVEDVEKVVRIAAHQSSGERDQPLRGAAEDAEAIALRRVAGQLVQFVGNGEIEPAAHIAADVFDRRHTLNAVPVRLPERREARRATTAGKPASPRPSACP